MIVEQFVWGKKEKAHSQSVEIIFIVVVVHSQRRQLDAMALTGRCHLTKAEKGGTVKHTFV